MYLGSLEECRAMGNMTLMCLYTKKLHVRWLTTGS